MGSVYGEDGNENGGEVKVDALQYLQLSSLMDFKLLMLPVILEFTREEHVNSKHECLRKI